MLARLDRVLAPARAAVDREGTFLRLEGLVAGSGQAAIDSVLSTVSEMGYLVEPLPSLPINVTRWYGTGEVEELSAEEARILAERWLGDLREEGLLGESDEEGARRSLEVILLRHVSRGR